MNATLRGVQPRGAGFTLLELVVVIALVGILIAVAANRLLPYIAQAESVAVIRVEGQLRNVLMMEAALRIARGDSARLVDLDGANPMNFLLEPPNNYLGEISAPARESLPRRSWYFDPGRGHLVYRAGRGVVPGIREYDVRIHFTDIDGNAKYSPGIDEFYGVRLEKIPGAGA